MEPKLFFNHQDIIKKYDLKPHVEGGYAALMYEDSVLLKEDSLPEEYGGNRPAWNAIYYLLPLFIELE